MAEDKELIFRFVVQSFRPAVTKGKLPNSNVEDSDSLGDAVQAPVKNDMVLNDKLLTDKPPS
ncbi:hypothetical protein BCON_0066g00230 [Botryotinia convoluta]|uniref:Uncharacterized protein n=1 Tax=Botryotinia convoluta TaxID=54673 RepID=A0A4Z1I9M1_9HELO|nr:hypothetical protein BCON_0066g00230 [Botryotinia convoluta]